MYKVYLLVIFLLCIHVFIIHFFQFIGWKVYDAVHGIIHIREKKLHLYGIWLYCGLYGGGKTMALSHYLTSMRKKYGNKIYISTNYGFKDEDFPLSHWKELLTEYDRPVIFGYDEVQNEFNSRDYKNFPFELVKLLTQNRKGNGKQIVCTAQRFVRVDKVIRELCTHVIECRTFFGRWTFLRKYMIDDYEDWLNRVNTDRKLKIHPKMSSFVQSNKLRQSYDSYQMLESARTKEYITQEEKLARSQEGGV